MQDLAYISSLSLVSASSFAMSDFAIECRLDPRWSGTSLAVLANIYPERRLVGERAYSGRGQSLHAVVLLQMVTRNTPWRGRPCYIIKGSVQLAATQTNAHSRDLHGLAQTRSSAFGSSEVRL